MDAQTLTLVSGVILSLLFSYVPKLNTWYAEKEKETKQLIMLGLLVLVTLVTYGLSCANILAELTGITIVCDKSGAVALIRSLVMAVIANQGVFLISPQTKAVKEAKG